MSRHQLNNFLQIRGEIHCLTGIHIGTGHGLNSVTKAPVICDALNQPFIPGSSLKGVFRSHLESMIHVFPQLRTCSLKKYPKSRAWEEDLEKGEAGCLSSYTQGSNHIQDALKRLQYEPDPEVSLDAFLATHLCDVCRLFGGVSWRAKVQFEDAGLHEDTHMPTSIRDGVGIDRETRKAAHQVKYDFEVVPAGSRFLFNLSARNLTTTEKGLLAIVLQEAAAGRISLGGKVTRGLGSWCIDLEKTTIDETDFADEQQLISFFSRKSRAAALKTWTNNQLNLFLSERGFSVAEA